MLVVFCFVFCFVLFLVIHILFRSHVTHWAV